jgi:hypothetical protein
MTPLFSFNDDWPGDSHPRQAMSARVGLAPLLVGGAMAVIAIAGRSRVGSWLRGFLTAGDGILRDGLRGRVQDPQLCLPRLRHELIGQTKAQVAARFGPPRTAVMTRDHATSVGQTAFWRADTWYYAVNSAEQTAMAIKFDRNRVWGVDFFHAPSDDTPVAV